MLFETWTGEILSNTKSNTFISNCTAQPDLKILPVQKNPNRLTDWVNGSKSEVQWPVKAFIEYVRTPWTSARDKQLKRDAKSVESAPHSWDIASRRAFAKPEAQHSTAENQIFVDQPWVLGS